MALDTVQDYLDRSRALLQDTIEPYRYGDDLLVSALNLAIMEARRIRPDMFESYLGSALPEYSTASLTDDVDIDVQYRSAFMYYMVGHAQLEDQEDNSDARATVFLNKFTAQLRTIEA
jgi:hypothetical protein